MRNVHPCILADLPWPGGPGANRGCVGFNKIPPALHAYRARLHKIIYGIYVCGNLFRKHEYRKGRRETLWKTGISPKNHVHIVREGCIVTVDKRMAVLAMLQDYDGACDGKVGV